MFEINLLTVGRHKASWLQNLVQHAERQRYAVHSLGQLRSWLCDGGVITVHFVLVYFNFCNFMSGTVVKGQIGLYRGQNGHNGQNFQRMLE